MKLVDNYLSETGRHLSDENREDILNELRVSLEDQVNDRAQVQHRQSTVEDERAVLLKMGHPLKLAASYKPERYLIGPQLFPAYVYSLKIGMVISLSLQLAIGLALSVNQNWDLSVGSLIERLLDTSIMVVTILTLSFVALEYSSEKLSWYDDWSPDALASGSTYPADMSDMVTNIVVEGFLLLWWNDILGFVSDSDAFPVILSSIWDPLFWPVNIILGISFLMHGFLLLREYWTRSLVRIELGLGISGVVVCLYLLVNRPLTTIANSELVSDWSWMENLGLGIVTFTLLVWLWELFKYNKMLRAMD